MTGIGPIPPSTAIFSYYSAANGQVSSTPLPTPLSEASAKSTSSIVPTSSPRNGDMGGHLIPGDGRDDE